MKTTQLHNFQYDFIKLKTQKTNTNEINWSNLKSHPTIKNAFVLEDGSMFHGQNFKLFLNKGNCAIIDTSFPYLKFNHNYVKISYIELGKMLITLEKLLHISLSKATVMEIEYGAYLSIDSSADKYIQRILGVANYDLNYSSSFMKMYGRPNLKFKIYDAIANAKKKRTFSRGDYPSRQLIKYELKYTNPSLVFKKVITAKFLHSLRFEMKLKSNLEQHIKAIVENHFNEIVPQGNSLNHFMYAALKNYEQSTGIKATNLIGQLITESNIDSSQKSKRRKAIKELESQYQK